MYSHIADIFNRTVPKERKCINLCVFLFYRIYIEPHVTVIINTPSNATSCTSFQLFWMKVGFQFWVGFSQLCGLEEAWKHWKMLLLWDIILVDWYSLDALIASYLNNADRCSSRVILKLPVRSSSLTHKLWLVEHIQITQVKASSRRVLSCARQEDLAAGASITHSAAWDHTCLCAVPHSSPVPLLGVLPSRNYNLCEFKLMYVNSAIGFLWYQCRRSSRW